MKRTQPAAPFWATPKPPPRLAGSHAALVAAAGAALPEGELVRAYDRASCYELGEALDHPQLGVGVVVELPAPGRVGVRFCDGDRLLVAGQPR